MKRCCVPGCCDNTSRRYSFPLEQRIQNIWLERINNPKLLGCDIVTLSKSYQICGCHFANICIDTTGRLFKYALPTLNLPDLHQPFTEKDCFSRLPQETAPVTPPRLKALLAKPYGLETSPGLIKPVIPPAKTYSLSTIDRPKPDHSATLLEVITEAAVRNADVEPIPSTSHATETSQQQFGSDHSATLLEVISEAAVRNADIEPIPSTSHATETSQQQFGSVKSPRHGILRELGVTRQSSLSPREKVLYKKTKSILQLVSKRLKNKQIKTKLNYLQKKEGLLKYFKDINDVTANFLLSQIRNQKFKARGLRFTVDDKILALSICKQSGRGYRFLSKIFSFPSRKVLTSMLNKIPFFTGVNAPIFNHLKRHVLRMKAEDRICILMFDEVSLSPGLQYNSRTDSVEGFVDSGDSNRCLAFADHALLFMIKGINKKWKQALCFTFCEGCTSTDQLSIILKEIVPQLRNCGLSVIATICDQGTTNCAAVNRLMLDTNKHFAEQNEENRLQGYLIDNQEIVHIFDFPHLMKCIRNMLLNKQLHFVQQGVKKVASWSHVLRLYELDKSGPYSQFVKLTDEHVIPSKIRKMKVKNCTRVFSHSVGTAMHLAARVSTELSAESLFYMDPKATDTADLLLFFDKLFDSVNGTFKNPLPGKELRTVVTKKSNHVSFWQSCLPILSSMYFTLPNSEVPIKPPCVKNWVSSIKSLIYLTPKLFNNFPPRFLNQDPIDNFFSCIRSHGVRNTNPTCSSFITSCKSLMINNFMSFCKCKLRK